MSPKLFDRQGVPVSLGKEIARGGEGAILEIQGHPKFVAKVYHKPPGSAKAEKLGAMVAGKNDRLVELSAWPVEVLRTDKDETIGVILPLIQDYQDIHLLYGPRSRLKEFPLATWPFLVRTAANLARCFSAIHDSGHVIGDVNDKVALVSNKSIVKLIDCDSFQINTGDKCYPCDVGVLTHQPPEFQDIKTFRGLRRSRNHDNFGLAVLIFQLLFMARHPYSGGYEGPEDMSLERAIKEYRYVYGRDAAKKKMKRPPFAVGPDCLTDEVAELFEKAFNEDGPRGMRPEPKDWVRTLDKLFKQVTPCKSNPSHAFVRAKGPCPFCKIETRTGSALFNLPILFQNRSGRKRTAVINIGTIWKEIRSVKSPGKMESLRTIAPRKRRPRREPAGHGMLYTIAGLVFIGGALALAPSVGSGAYGLLAAIPILFALHKRDGSGNDSKERRLDDLEARWEALTTPQEFDKYNARLKQAKKALDNLGAEHDKKIKSVHSRKQQDQLDAFLDSHKIEPGKVKGISSAATVILQSYGIETAKDVKQKALNEVPSIGPTRVKALLDWRAQLEGKFQFDPSKGVDPLMVASVERAIEMKRAHLVQLLAEGPAKLRHIAKRTHVRRLALQTELGAITDTQTAGQGQTPASTP